MHKAQSLINHVAIVLDASYSMKGLEREVTRATDAQIKHLAKRSAELNQETRVSVYYFGETTIECLIFDMDVARLPSTEYLYKVLYENTALLDATMKSQKDLETTSQLYGDHAFLTFVLTDGQENRSKRYTRKDLQNHLKAAPVNWSLGFLVPDEEGVRDMESLGVLRDSIAVWDATLTGGFAQAASAIQQATDDFMTNRSRGVRGTKSVFSTAPQNLNRKTVTSNLEYLTGVRKYHVPADERIDTFVEAADGRYVKGTAYYQLTKAEDIQPTKQILVVDKSNGNVYGGANGRSLLGLPATGTVRVRPDHNPKYDVFVQSTSLNRKLKKGTKVLVKS